ncbi:MAG: TRAP transporter large permease [Candidatus Methylomirabilales bacterium]
MGATLIVTFFVGMLLGVPIAISMGGSGLVALLVDGKLSLLTVPQRFFNGINSFPLMAVPFFILAADLMSASGITLSLLRFTNSLVGHIRGGLGHVNILTEMIFSGISGSALADAAGPGALVMRMMKKAGYDEYYAAALTAANATIGPIIPPSIIMVIYAITDSKVTVAGLFLAGVVPGILMGLALALVNHLTAVRRHYLFRAPVVSWRERLRSMWRAVPALLMPAIIVGGILGGVFTATEASAVGVFYALFVGFFVTKKLTLRMLPGVVVQSALVSSAALLIVSMASLFANILTLVQVPQKVAAYITSLSRDPVVIITLVAVFVLICGLFIDTLPAVIILVPVLAPVADQVGIDPLHFAMAFVLNITIGMVTPPVGAVLFIITAVGGLNFEKLSRAILPMLVALFVVLALVVYVPAISLALPRWLGFAR